MQAAQIKIAKSTSATAVLMITSQPSLVKSFETAVPIYPAPIIPIFVSLISVVDVFI
jgi:hypothetical protein